MTNAELYGTRLDEHWRGQSSVSSLLVKGRSNNDITVARVIAGPGFGFVEHVPPEEGYAFSLELIDYQKGELWLGGRNTPQTNLLRNHSVFFDLRNGVDAKLEDPFDFVHFHIPRRYFADLAAAGGMSAADELRVESGHGFFDPVLMHLGLAMLPALDRPAEVNQLFLDHTMIALCSHIAGTYGVAIEPRAVAKGLAGWRLRRAKDLIASRLNGDISIAEIAAECGLTPSYFARQFAEATGTTPHRWLLKMRVEQAKQLMAEGRLSLADVAMACGFADQSHFTRVFSRETGATPRAWRDQLRR
ncbi:helix-turn-helix domain-containing protein [Bradyrhizobium sp. HKCCYLS3077]|uniref:helix-turn-helix domain-containing protein n=1 Tax=unclassified Bradyrhizobium TaxID=2631580 RepID=UPI003EC06D04